MTHAEQYLAKEGIKHKQKRVKRLEPIDIFGV